MGAWWVPRVVRVGAGADQCAVAGGDLGVGGLQLRRVTRMMDFQSVNESAPQHC